MVKNSKLRKRQAPRNENEKKEPTTEEVAKSFERDSQEKKKRENQDEKAEASKRPSPTPIVHLLTSRSDVKT